jgi:alpha-mannosidase
VRLYEAWGRRGPVTLTAPWDIGRGARTDLLEREIGGLPGHGNQVTLDLSPFEIATLRLERAGATSTS